MSKPKETEATEPAKRKRGGDPIDAFSPEIRGFVLIDRAFDGVPEDAQRRLAAYVADKYGPPPAIVLPRLSSDDVADIGASVRFVRE